MFLAFFVGILTGFCFTPIALAPISMIFLAVAAGLWGFAGDLGTEKLVLSAIYLAILNSSYLLGAIGRRWWSARR
jgi:hypothetical protein